MGLKALRMLTQQHHQFSSHSCKQDLLAVCPMLLSDQNIKQKFNIISLSHYITLHINTYSFSIISITRLQSTSTEYDTDPLCDISTDSADLCIYRLQSVNDLNFLCPFAGNVSFLARLQFFLNNSFINIIHKDINNVRLPENQN